MFKDLVVMWKVLWQDYASSVMEPQRRKCFFNWMKILKRFSKGTLQQKQQEGDIKVDKLVMNTMFKKL